MKVRIPGWVRNQVVPSDLYEYTDGKRLGYTVTVNGKAVKEASITDDGYYTIMRNWKRGDKVAVHFDMQPRTVSANGKRWSADKGMVSVERGPIVYCAEWPDNNFDIMSTLINPESEIRRCGAQRHALRHQRTEDGCPDTGFR